jgi:hypothetical protein
MFKKNNYNYFSKLFSFSIIITSLISYPSSLQIFYPIPLRILVIFSFSIAFIYAFYCIKRNYDFLTNGCLVWFLILWMGYFTSLSIGTFFSGYEVRMYNYLSYASKMAFFLLCLLYLDKKTILNAVKIYSHLALFITILSIFIGVLVALQLISYSVEISKHLPDYLKFYYLVFYAQSSPLEFVDFPLYRLQGYSTEAGVFALSLIMPALFFLIFEKNYFKFSIIIIGIAWTFSFPAFAGFLLFSILSFFSGKRNLSKTLLLVFVTLLSVVFITELMEAPKIQKKQEIADNLSFNDPNASSIHYDTFLKLRVDSWQDRTDAMTNYFNYMGNKLSLFQKLFGLGAGNAIYSYKETIANGFLFRLIDAGIIGFIFYSLSALAIGFYAFKSVIGGTNDELTMVLALSSIFLLLVSILRQSYDMSYWQMFIYASFFVNRIRHSDECSAVSR